MKIRHLVPLALASIVSLSNAASPGGMPVIIVAIHVLGNVSIVNADQVGSGYTISSCGQIVSFAAAIFGVQIDVGGSGGGGGMYVCVACSCAFGRELERPYRE